MTSIVEVKLELGHRAKVREVPLPEGHTHDWVIFVKGSEGVQLEHFVEKVVFWLHESYDQPKRVIKHPPYKVEQSGYAGFNMLIDVHFRNKEDPKMVRFQYDLFLHTEAMPPVNHTRLEKLTFTNPTEDFRKKLLKAGGIPINLSSSHSKDRHERSPGYPSKKDKTKNKEGLKQRERSSSSGRKDQDERKKMSAYIGKKDGRIAGKDMKHHDTEFKQPKDMFNASRIRKESGSEKPEVIERGRSEKRKSLSTEDSGNKKKKRYSEDLSSANSKSKSLIAPSGSTSVSGVNSNKKEKNKKVKENMIEGLFAPGASININQIKQNKDKGKQDGTDVKLKKEKITVPCKRTSSKDSSVPSTSESLSTRYSKVSVGNDLTLKIKKIPSTKSKGKKSSSENAKKLSESNSERKQTKESVLGKAAIDSSCEQQGKKKRPLISPSSSSSSDMDISDEDISKKEKEQEEPKTEKKYNTTTKSKSKIKACEEQAKVSESSLVKKFSRSKTKNKDLAKHTDVNTSLASVESKFKEKLMQKTKTKLNKSGKDDGRRSETLIREEDQSLKKSKKHKHSSKERSHSSFLIKKSRSLTSKIADVPLSEIVPGSEKPKIVSETYPAPGATFLDERNDISTKMSDSSKWDRKNSKKSDKGQTSSPESTCKKSKKGYILAQVKTSPNVSSLEVARTTAQSKKTFKSNSFVETSSDEDSEFEYLGDTKSVLEDGKKLSVSSSSSLISHDNSNIDSDVDERHHNDQVHQTSAPSPSSSDEGEISVFPPAEESTLPVISPIADKSISHSANENSLCNDMELSDSSGGSPFKYHRDHTNCTIVTFNEIPQGSMNNGLPPFSLQDDISSSTDEDDDASPVQKPFQYQQERNESLHGFIAEHDSNNNDSEQDSAACSRSTSEPMVEVTVGAERKSYPHLTGPLYKELQEIHRKLSYITDVNRLRKIALIVAKSQKTEISPNYFDFDLCSLDHSTIHKIQKHLKAT